jgi:glycosyltransferase involved in cell wall biosynthesis
MNKNEFYNIQKYQNTLKNPQEKKKIKKCLKYNITIVIYCNQSRYLGETIYSIINQIDSFNEIIIVYDNKDEDNLKFIKNLINDYENIRIINNNENKGILYSYSVGVLKAKGEFILSLQSGYTLTKKDILFNLYSTAKDHNLDILEFNLLINEQEIIRNNSLNLYKCSHFQSNKDWNIIKSDEKYKDLDQEKELLFNKLIKTEIYKKIIKDYKLNEKKIIIYNYYDNILMFLFNKYKLHFLHIDEFGVIKNNYNKDFFLFNDIINDKEILINDSISYINFLYDNSKNTFFDKTNVLKEFINLLSVIYNKFTKITDNSIKLIEKFINCKYINEVAKNELQFYYKSLIN